MLRCTDVSFARRLPARALPLVQAGAGPLAGFSAVLLAGLAAFSVSVAVQAAPIAATLAPPAPRAEPAQGGQVLDRALSGDLGGAGLPSKLSLELRPDSGSGGGGRAQPDPSAARLPPAARMAPVHAPAAPTAPTAAAAQAPSLLGGQLAGGSNEAAARPDGPKLARDWDGGGRSAGAGVATVGGDIGRAAGPGAGLPRTPAGAAPALGPLLWLSQGLAFIREHRMTLLAGVGTLALAWMVQQARSRRRRA